MAGMYGNEYHMGPSPNPIAMIVGLGTMRIGLLLMPWWSKCVDAGDFIFNEKNAHEHG